MHWSHESVAYWNADKARIVGGAAEALPKHLAASDEGAVLPGDWWRVEQDGTTVGFGWMDVTWGDAEILLVVDPSAQSSGVGTFILEHLEAEARARGIHYLYNEVPAEHPARARLTHWLEQRAFRRTEDGALARAVVRAAKTG